MYFATKPTRQLIERFIAAERDHELSYENVGATRGQAPAGFVVDHNRVRLGSGMACFDRARIAVTCWKMFDLGWVELCWPDARIEAGATVAVLAHTLGVWSLNACRIVYLIDENAATLRFGFAYGTLPDHAESGEERFSVEWHRSDDSVWYDILAFSRPHQWPARLALPFTRRLQRRFARDSLAAMQRAVHSQDS